MGEVPFTTSTCTAPCATRSTARCPSRSATGSTRSRWWSATAPTRCATPLVSGMSVGTDVILDPEDLEASFAPGRNFANKLWNAGRFILVEPRRPDPPARRRHASVVRREELDPGRPLDHRALRRHACARPPRPTSASGSTRRPARSTTSSGATSPTGTSSRSSRGSTATQPGGDVARAVAGADLRRGAPAAAPGHAVRHRGALAPLPRPAGGRLDLGRALARPDARAADADGAAPSSGWSRSWSARSAASGPSTACSRARRCARA